VWRCYLTWLTKITLIGNDSYYDYNLLRRVRCISMVTVNHHNLRWARNAANLSIDDAAQRLGLASSSKSTAAEKLQSIEDGDRPPTQPQLSKMANAYRVPVVAFYLDSEPRKGDLGEDYRTIPQKSEDTVANAHLAILLSNVKARQSITRDLLEDEDAEPLQFVSSGSIAMGVERIANDIVQSIGFNLEQFRRRPSQPDYAFKYLRSRIQSIGIFVLLMSDLGHPQTTTIPVSVFRGFVLADDIAPFIVINRKDNKRAQSFTALHEVAHLWLGTSGITGMIDEYSSSPEQFCNRVAGNILLPRHELSDLSSIRNDSFDTALDRITEFANSRNLSRAMVAYNLKLEDHISPFTWHRIHEWLVRDHAAREQLEREQREIDRALGKSTPIDANVVRRSALGEPLLSLARRAVASGALTPTRASTLLGVNPRRVRTFLNPERRRRET